MSRPRVQPRRAGASLLPRLPFLLLSLASLAACGHAVAPGATPGELARLAAAIADAEVATEAEVYPALRPVQAEQLGLVWQAEAGESPVLVVTWTGWDGYDGLVGGELTLSRPVWVSLVPELRQFCRHHHPHRPRTLVRRLEELLGLRPQGDKTRFVELWVEPADLVRPCPDKEITDRACGTEFPPSEPADSEYRRWFEELEASSYGEDGYPWTRLGYTYDWGNPISRVGLSEYVVWTGATVGVRSVSKLREYCGP